MHPRDILNFLCDDAAIVHNIMEYLEEFTETQKYDAVVRQLHFYREEFKYQRQRKLPPSSFYVRHYVPYVLFKNKCKMELNSKV